MSTGNGQLSVGENAEHMMLRFDAIDELMQSNSDGEQDAITTHLNGGMDLHSVLARHEAELSALREDFIAAHVDEAENICSLYMEFVECEKKLVGFEEEIIAFQRRLADSADDMVKMQQQTVSLVRSINNRRLCSSKLSEVYTVLQECDAFCSAIAQKEVDQSYLENISELERQLTFFSSNKELKGSAVDLETRPRLHAAAVRAGDKLQRYFRKQFVALAAAEDLISIESQQQSLVETGQNAIKFLKNYHPPIAEVIFQEYAKRMSDAFARLVRAVLHDFGELCLTHTGSIDTIITADDVHDVVYNRDTGAPKGNHVAVAAQALKFPVHPFPRRERSLSQHMRHFAGRMLKTERPMRIRETTIYDTVAALSTIRVRGETFSLDAAAARSLENAGNWPYNFLCGMHLLVNLCTSECQFIRQFFCFSSAEDEYGGTEALVRVVLSSALDIAQNSIREALSLLTDRQSTLASLRIVDIVKTYFCCLSNPVPLLLLSGIMESAKRILSGTLHRVVANDQESTQFLTSLRLSPFQFVPSDSKVNLNGLLEDRQYAVTLGPHPIVRRFSQIAGEMELLNSASFEGSRVDGVNVLLYDFVVASALYSELENVLEFVVMLAKRHKNSLAQRIFALNNYFYIQAYWRHMSGILRSVVEIEQLPSAAPPAHVSCITSRLSNELACFVDEDSKVNGIFGYLFDFVHAAEATLGSAFFTDDAPLELSLDALPAALSEAETLQVVSDLSQGWQTQLSETCTLVRQVVSWTFTDAAAAVQDEVALNSSKELEELILKKYTQAVVEANTKLHVVVTRLFAKHNEMRARLTSNATVLHEVKKVLQSR
ncbi:putative leucine-rich repeat protein [Trypanosoma rangeli]|uniref:Putative leucine-rich repeat protein n=1 Tax=Trypanosoma rangeli TaxID=5698 RepID=A0A422NRZ3_TRYRA|nr:putative leucine-rich repeat protein [Trypanosoma rangeli]RNF08255.1 putative leucine-rich repeat protein [Trypanosoma rangeli]|eukprot:RNF08255.1 putative leucine-rich repeat protein [Trypanosoma rangeli]